MTTSLSTKKLSGKAEKYKQNFVFQVSGLIENNHYFKLD